LRFGFSAAGCAFGRKGGQPGQAARVLLLVIDAAPRTVERVLRRATVP